nr:lactonase family protein [Paenibacillus sp. GSMTC-2017]
MLVFVGSYAEANENGLHVYTCNESNGELTEINVATGIKNPTFLNVDSDRGLLYSIGEGANEDGKKVGELVSYRIDKNNGALTLLNRRLTVTSTTCHVQRDNENRHLIVSSYHGGMIGLLRIAEDGSIGQLLDVQQHEGRSVDTEDQDKPHPHSSFFSPDGQFLFVPDLGIDKIVGYTVDKENNKLIRHNEVAISGASGPRHFVFHPNATFAYSINELNSTITVFSYDQVEGELTVLETVSTLPESFVGENSCAEITISKDGRFIYGSNRGHDSIVVFGVKESTGQLSPIQHISVEGGHPRHFALSPNGNYLIAANRDTNNLVTFHVNNENGNLRYTGYSIEASKPVCVIPVYFN